MSSRTLRLRLAARLLAIVAGLVYFGLNWLSVSASETLVQVQSANNNGGSSPISASYSPAATAGDLLVVICGYNAASTITAPSGFSTAINETTNPAQGIFYKLAQGGETSVSCAYTGSGGSAVIQIYEYSGIELLSPLDAVNSTTSTGSGSTASTGSLTSRNANDLLIGAIISDASSGVGSWANSFTQETATTSGGKPQTRVDATSADLVVSSTGSYSATTTAQSGSNWRGQIAAFKIAPAIGFSGDIVNGSGTSIASPSVALSAVTSAFSCQTATGTLGSSSQKIRVINTNPLDSRGWTLAIAASSANWSDGAGHSYAYNNSAGSPAGCSYGQLSLVPAALTISPETAPEFGCTNTGLSPLSGTTPFSGTTPITLVSASTSASYYCYWDITGIGLSQTIPAGQPSGAYSLGLTLTLTAN